MNYAGKYLELAIGLAPTSFRLQGEGSSIELHQHVDYDERSCEWWWSLFGPGLDARPGSGRLYLWSRHRELNPDLGLTKTLSYR